MNGEREREKEKEKKRERLGGEIEQNMTLGEIRKES